MRFFSYGRAAWSSLAASLAIHGVAVAGLALSTGSGSRGLPSGERAQGGAAFGGVVIVSLLAAPAGPGPAAADAVVSRPPAPRPSMEPPAAGRALALERPKPRRRPAELASARRADSHARPRLRAEAPPASPPGSEERVEIASAPAPPPQSLPHPRLGAESLPAWRVTGSPTAASGPASGPLAGLDPGPGGRAHAGRLDRLARPVGSIRPHYPPRARQRGEEADVAVEVWVGARGDVDRVAVSRSAGAEFDAAAVAAVRGARFQPALRDGKRVASRVALRLHFRLEG